jgi:hypothetical protein
MSVYDQEGDTVNCSLFISKDDQTSWTYNGSSIVSGTPGIPTNGTCYKEVHDFACSDIDSSSNQKWFKWEVVNGNPNHAWNTSPEQGPILNESVVNVIYTDGNNTVFNRSNGANQVRHLGVNVYDTDNSSYASNANVEFWITNDTVAYRFEKQNATDTLGNASYWFNPNCTHNVGQQTWIAGVVDSCYADKNTSTNFTFNITGDLRFNITSPISDTVNNSKYLIGESNVIFRGNISDECGSNINNAIANFTAIQSGVEHSCSSIFNEGNGTYNCTVLGSGTSAWTPSNTTAGIGYSVKFNASAVNYNYNSTTESCSPATSGEGCIGNKRGFLLETRPILTGPTVSSSGDGGWGETWTFGVNATDRDWDNLRVRLYVRYCTDDSCTSFNPDWITVTNSPTGCTPSGCVNSSVKGVNNTVTFVVNGEDEITSTKVGKWQYKFNTTDYPVTDTSWDYNESAVNNFTVYQDDVNITYVYGDNSLLNRSIAPDQSNANFSVRVYDKDTGKPIGSNENGGKLFVTTNPNNNNNFILDQIKSTTSGYLNFTFMNVSNRCNYGIGPLKWRVEFGGGLYNQYKTVNSSSWYSDFNVNTTTYPLQVNILGPNNQTYRKNVDAVPFVANVTDDCGGVVNASNSFFQGYYGSNYPVWAICSGASVTDIANNGTYNCSKLPTVSDYSRYNITFNATKDYYNNSQTITKIDSFWVVSNPQIWNGFTNKAGDNGGWGETWDFYVTVKDLDAADLSFERMNLSLWLNLTGDWQLVNSTLLTGKYDDYTHHFIQHFNCGDKGAHNYKFNVSDFWDYTNTTASSPFTVDKDYVSVSTSDSIDPDSISRESGTGRFIFRIKDTATNTYVTNTSTNASIYFTWDRSSYAIGYDVNPNSTGYVNYDLDPNCSYAAGTQRWTASVISSDSCYQQSSNMTYLTFDVIGQLKNNLTLPGYNSQHNVTEQIPVNFTTLSDCSNRADENPVVNATSYKIELSQDGSSWQTCNANNSYAGWYNCTWNSTNKTEGLWDIRVNSTQTNFTSNSSVYVDWFNLLNWNVSNTSSPVVSPIQGGWTRLYNYTVNVSDQEGDTVNCSLFISKDNQVSWEYKGSSIVVGSPGTPTNGVCYKDIHDFTCGDIDADGKQKWFMWEIVNGNPNHAWNTTPIEGPILNQSNVTVVYITGNSTVSNRTSGGNQVRRLGVNVRDDENLSYAPSANVEFWITNDTVAYRAEKDNATDVLGNASYWFDPNCTHNVGQQTWIAGVVDSCYEDKNTSTNYTFNITGDLWPFIISPKGEKYLRGNYNDGQNISIQGNVTDECNQFVNNSMVNFSAIRATTINYCNPLVNNGDGSYNCSLNTSSFSAKGWDMKMNASRENYNYNETNETYLSSQRGFWVETKPVLTTDFSYQSYNSTGHLGDGGWGETWIFRVNATDEDNDTLTVKMWVNSTTGDWSQGPNATATSNNSVWGNNTTVTFTIFGWASSNPGIAPHVFKFNVSENSETQFPQNINETSNGTFTIQKDDVAFILTDGNNTVINRTSGDQLLSLRVYDTDKGTSTSNFQGNIWITNDTLGTFVPGAANPASGTWINVTFNPGCGPSKGDGTYHFDVGPQKWKGGITSSSAYKTVNSTNFTLNITTYPIQINFSEPTNARLFLKGIENVTLKANISDDCGALAGANLTFVSQQMLTTPTDKSCTESPNNEQVKYEGEGRYNCTFKNTTHADNDDWKYGYVNASVFAEKQYYNASQTILITNSYYLSSRPVIDDVGTPYGQFDFGSTAWGDLWSFSDSSNPIDITDADMSGELESTINVSLWINLTGNWEFYGSKICKLPTPGNCSGGSLAFTSINFMCNRTYSDTGTHGFKINVTDNFNYTNEKTGTFTITRDPSSAISAVGDGNSVGREGVSNTYLAAIFYDSIKGTINFANVNGSLWVTSNGVNFGYYNSTQTQNDGYLNFSFNPDCNYSANTQWWKISINDSCYVDSYTDNQSAYVVGQLKNSVIQPTKDSVFSVGSIVTLKSNISSDCLENISSASVTHEAMSPSGTWEQANASSIINEAFGIYNSSWNTTFHQGGNWSLRINASKDNYYSNSTIFTNWTYLNNTPPINENVSVSPSTAGWGSNFSFRIDLNDAQYDNVSCKLFTYTSGSWTYRGSNNVSMGIGTCVVNVTNFTCNDINATTNWFRWELNDSTNIFNTSNFSAPNITRDTMIISYIDGNNTTVNRNGTQTDLLTLRIFDNNSKKYVGSTTPNATGRIFVTTDDNSFDSGTQNTTNSSGYLNIYFEPGWDYAVGPQKWKGGTYGDTCYYDSNSTENYTLTVKGELINSVSYISPDEESGSVLRPDNVTMEINVKDDKGNGVEGASLNITLINSLYGSNFTCSNVKEISEGNYNCTINTSLTSAGWYNLSIISNKTYYNNGYLFRSNAFYVETVPQLTSPIIISKNGNNLGGWGENWTATTNVTDEDQDNITLTIQVKKYTDPDEPSKWVDLSNENQTTYTKNPDLRGPLNKTVNLTFVYTAFKSYQDVWQVRVIANDTDNNGFVSNYTNFTIEKNDILIELVSGNGNTIWRNGTQSTYLSFNVTDLDQNLPAKEANITFFITTNNSNASSFDSGTTVSVDENGVAQYNFDPECLYSTGVQHWYGAVIPDAYYKYNYTQNYSLTIMTYIALDINYPSGQSFLKGSMIPFVGRVYDECFNISNATVTFRDRYLSGSTPCGSTTDMGNGTYNCTYNSATSQYGWHGVQMNAVKQYYGTYPTSNQTTRYTQNVETHFIASSPTISLGWQTNLDVNPKVDGWGKLRTFEATLSDSDQSMNNVSLWKSFDNVTWYLINTTNTTPATATWRVRFNDIAPFMNRFACGDLFNATNGTVYFKFNTTSIFGYTAETPVDNFTVETDNVTVTLDSSSSSNVRRIGNNIAMLRFSIRDDDYGNYYPTNVNSSIWISLNGADYIYNTTNTSYSGNVSAYYNPDCNSSAGVQYWKGGTTDSCYEVKNTTNTTSTVYGQLNVSVINPTSGSIINRDKIVNLNASIRDECSQSVSGATVNWLNSSSYILSAGYNTTWHVPITYKLGPETITTNATKTYYDYNTNSTPIYIYGWSTVSYITPLNGTHYSYGDDVPIACLVKDINTTQSLQNYPVTIYKNNSILNSNNTDSNGFVNKSWSTSGESAGWYNLTCSINNNSTLFYNTSVPENETWVMLERPLMINQIKMDSSICQQDTVCNWIYRNDSFNPHQINITVHVNDANTGSSANGANVTFYNSTNFLGNCTTDPTGWCSLINYNPSNSLNPNIITIYINATRPENENSQTNTTLLRVKGILNTSVISPPDTLYCGASGYDCSKSQAINLTVKVFSENGENSTILNPSISWYNETSLVTSGGVNIILSSTKVAEQQTGNHNFMVIATKDNYDDGIANVTFNISGIVHVYWTSPTGIVPYPNNFYPTCFVRDEDSQQGVNDYIVNFSYKWEPSSNFIFNGTYSTNSTGYALYDFIPSQKGNITLNCTIGNNASRYYSITPPYDTVAETFWVKDVSPPQIYNVSMMPNNSIEANLNYTNITVFVSDNYQISSVWAYIKYPNQTFENRTLTNLTVPQIGFGNYNATYNLTFIPPTGGVYNITIYARDAAPENNINSTQTYNISVWGTISGSVSQCVNNTNDGDLTDCNSQITAPFISQTNSFTFEVRSNFTNLGPATAYSVNLTHVEDPLNSLTYSEQSKLCGTLHPNETCSWNFNVTVLAKTRPSLIRTYVNANWRNPDNTNQYAQNLTEIRVDSNPILNILETELIKTIPHNQNTYIGNITVISAGNDEVRNINISWYGITGVQNYNNLALYCPLCALTIFPNQETILSAGENFSSNININVPPGQEPGKYIANIIAMSTNAGNDTTLMNLTIPTNNTWLRTPSTFGTALAPQNTSNVIGNITVFNIGNVKIPFEVVKSGDNGYAIIEGTNWYSFDLEKQNSRNLSISYSVPVYQPNGIYNVTIYVRNSSADPPVQNVTFVLNVTDIPPNITDVIISPLKFEQGYENVTIQANVTDNYAVDRVWVNITPPNGLTFTTFMDNPYDSIYNTTYVYPVTGVHQIMICANDTQSLWTCISPINITSSDTTELTVTTNASIINATNITQESGQSFAINLSVNNIGGSRSLDTNVTITYPSKISASPNNFTFGLILKNNSKSNETTIYIENATSPGVYVINFTVNWINLNNAFNTSRFNLTINVTPNPLINIQESAISKVIWAGNSGNQTLTLRSIGNDNATDIIFNCISGEVCSNFTVSFDPQNISLMNIGDTNLVNATFGIPTNYITGLHLGTIEVNWSDSLQSQNFSKHIPVDITVPANISWMHNPTEISKRANDNEIGTFGEINITNTGNANMTLNITINGTIAPYLNLSAYNLTLNYGEAARIYIDYSSPNITAETNYSGYIITNITGNLRENASEKEKSTFATLSVTPYSVRIVYPTQDNPITGVSPGNNVQSKVIINENGTAVNSSMAFDVKLFNDTFSTTANVTNYSFDSSQNLWLVNFTAPSMSIGRVYDLNITATHVSAYNHTRYSVEYDSIVYTDNSAPIINIIIPLRVPANQTVNIKVNVTEPGGLKNITSNMRYPNSSLESITLSFISRINGVYTYEVNFSNTAQLNDYTFNVTACDLSSNCNSNISSFEIYPTVYFSGYAKDVELLTEPSINVNFMFLDSGTNNTRFNFNSNISNQGYYNETIDAKSYDLTISTSGIRFNNIIILNGLSITNNYYNPVIFGSIPSVRTSNSVLKGLYVNNTLPPSNITISMDFSECLNSQCGFPIFNPNHLSIYHYTGTWTSKVSSTDNTLFEKIANINKDNSDNSVNLTTLNINAHVSSLNGIYVLAEFICGNGDCEAEYGESSSNCPTDCPYLVQPPSQPGGGGTGGAGGGAGAGAGAGAGGAAGGGAGAGGGGGGAAGAITQAQPGRVPLEIKSTLLETTLAPGEQKILSIDITNNLDSATSATLSVEGPAFALLSIQKAAVTINSKSTEVIEIKAEAPMSSVPGIYTGELVVKSGNIVHRIPITITIKAVLIPLLDVKIKVLTKEVNPGSNLSFELSLLNMGETAKVEDITITYSVKPINNQTNIISTSKETVAVDNADTVRRTIEIPKDAPEDKYIIEANASYWYGNKFASSADNFDVTTLPLPLLLLKALFMNWMTYVVLLGGIPALIIGIRWYSALRASKVAKARYIAPLDFKVLPQAGPDSLLVGKIAETDVKAYLNIPQLLMHSIAAGGTGSGKTVSAMVTAEELLKRKVPIVVFDPTAQWTGFMKPCTLKPLLDLYARFGLKPTDATRFKTNIILVEDSEMPIDIKGCMKPGEITVFVMNRLPAEKLDNFVKRSIQAIFDMRPPESKEIKMLVVYDEVHRLLPKYGGKKGYIAIERACREFRKWGIGIFLISQVLLDFKGAIRANIANEIQLRTKYEGDIGRVKSKYGIDYASKVTRLMIGTGLFQNPEFNHGRPWFLSFRPLLHSPFALTDDEVNTYVKLDKKVKDIEGKLQKLKEKKVDTYDIEVELNIAKDKVKTAAFRMAETYLESIDKRLEKMGVK